MEKIIEDKQAQLHELCRRFHVSRLEVFGSASIGRLREDSDLDFLVEFDDSVGSSRFDTFFELLESLKQLFGRPIDLVEPGGLSNPYFLKRVNETRRPLYVA